MSDDEKSIKGMHIWMQRSVRCFLAWTTPFVPCHIDGDAYSDTTHRMSILNDYCRPNNRMYFCASLLVIWDMHHAIEQPVSVKPLYQCERAVASEPYSLVFIDRCDAENLERR